MFSGQLVDGVFHAAVTFVLPAALLGDGGYGVVGRSVQLFGSRQVVALGKLPV